MPAIHTRRDCEVLDAASILDEMEADPELYLDGLPAGQSHVTELLDARVGRKHGPRTVVRTAVTRLLLDSGRLKLARGSTEVSTRPRYVAIEHIEPEPETPPAPMAKPAATPARQPAAGETCTLPPIGSRLSTADLLACLSRSAASSVAYRVRNAANRVDTDGPGHVFAVDQTLVEAIAAEGYAVEHDAVEARRLSADVSGDGQASPEPETPAAPDAEPEPDESPDLEAGDVHAPAGLADGADRQRCADAAETLLPGKLQNLMRGLATVDAPEPDTPIGAAPLYRTAADARAAQDLVRRVRRTLATAVLLVEQVFDVLPAEVGDQIDFAEADLSDAEDLLGQIDAALR